MLVVPGHKRGDAPVPDDPPVVRVPLLQTGERPGGGRQVAQLQLGPQGAQAQLDGGRGRGLERPEQLARRGGRQTGQETGVGVGRGDVRHGQRERDGGRVQRREQPPEPGPGRNHGPGTGLRRNHGTGTGGAPRPRARLPAPPDPPRPQQGHVLRRFREQLRVRDPHLRAEQRRERRPGPPRLDRHHLPQHARQLLGHLLRGGEPARRVRVGGPYQEAVERLVRPEDRDVLRVGQRVHEDVRVALEVEGQHGERARHRVQVARHRGADLGHLRRLVADRAVDRGLVVVHPPDRAHVDELQLVLGLYGVVDLEVAVQQVPAVQVPERLQGLDAVRAGLLHRQRVAPPVGRPAPVGDLLERLAADVLHDDVAVQGAGPLVEVLDEVVDPDDVGVLDLGEEAALGDRRCHGVLVAGVQQALEDDPAVRDGPVDGEVDPAQTAVRQAARHLVLAVDDVPGPQLRHEGVRVPAAGAEALRAARPVAPRAAHRGPAVGAGAEPLPLGDLGVLHHRGPRVGARHLRDRDQARAEPVPGGLPGRRARAAHRHRTARGRPGQRAREAPRDRPARSRGAGRGPRTAARGAGVQPADPRARSCPRARARLRARTRPRARSRAGGPAGHGQPGPRRADHPAGRDDRREPAGVAVQLAAAHVLVRALARGALAGPRARLPAHHCRPPAPSAFPAPSAPGPSAPPEADSTSAAARW